MSRRSRQAYERFPIENSPWAQNLNQRQLAELLHTTKDRLEAIIRDKERWALYGVSSVKLFSVGLRRDCKLLSPLQFSHG